MPGPPIMNSGGLLFQPEPSTNSPTIGDNTCSLILDEEIAVFSG